MSDGFSIYYATHERQATRAHIVEIGSLPTRTHLLTCNSCLLSQATPPNEDMIAVNRLHSCARLTQTGRHVSIIDAGYTIGCNAIDRVCPTLGLSSVLNEYRNSFTRGSAGCRGPESDPIHPSTMVQYVIPQFFFSEREPSSRRKEGTRIYHSLCQRMTVQE